MSGGAAALCGGECGVGADGDEVGEGLPVDFDPGGRSGGAGALGALRLCCDHPSPPFQIPGVRPGARG